MPGWFQGGLEECWGSFLVSTQSASVKSSTYYGSLCVSWVMGLSWWTDGNECRNPELGDGRVECGLYAAGVGSKPWTS